MVTGRATARAALSLLVAVLLLVTGVGTANAASPKVTVSASAYVAVGGSVTAKITLTGSSAKTAYLQIKSGGTWKSASRTIALTKGKGSTALKPTAARTYRIKAGGAYSKAFTITPVTLTAAAAASPITRGSSTTAEVTVKPAITASAKLQYLEGSTWVTARTFAVTKGKASTSLKPTDTRKYRVVLGAAVSKTITVVVVPKPIPDEFVFTGSGWGHGVGMSQYGAYGMAKQGSTATQILTHYYTGTAVESVPAAGDIRVHVFGSGSDSTTSAVLTVRSPGTGTDANGGWRLRVYGAGSSTPSATWTGLNDEAITVTRSESTLSFSRAGGATTTGATATLEWEATTGYLPTSPENPYVEVTTASGTAATNGTYRHGRLELSVTNSRLTIVNVLKLNTEYLYGVAEMPSSWSTEALKAQAIAARGFALRKVASGVLSTCACNLYDDSRSQNFTGWKKENEGTSAVYGKRWVAAVDGTNGSAGATGKVLTYGAGGAANIATTYYFSSSGGQTENSEKVWTEGVSYLRSVDDHWSVDGTVSNPNASWTRTVSQQAVALQFGLPNVVSLTISERTSSAPKAAAYVITATAANGDTSVLTGADNVRIAFGLKSPWVWSITPR
ncbi:SpoIID/LytB domain-containing protein [Demequina sp.]|uniref:SpoIID/LytB domain-containing protein n=1 Tax=Demequina sp. TaxID=2050685 RepID=UPI003D108DF6